MEPYDPKKRTKSPARVLATWPDPPGDAARVAYLLRYNDRRYAITVTRATAGPTIKRNRPWGEEFFRIARQSHAWHVWEAFKQALIDIG